MYNSLNFKDMAEDYDQSLDGNVNRVLDLSPTVDVRQLASPIQEYEEFHTWRENVNDAPHYKFGVTSLSCFTQRNMELVGEEFFVPELYNTTTQIKCSANHDHLLISVRFIKPFLPPTIIAEIEPAFNPIVSVLLTANDAGFRIKFCRVFPFTERLYFGEFYPIVALPFESCVKSFMNNYSHKDSATLRFLVKNGHLHDVPAPPQGRLLWTVLVPHLNLKTGVCFENETQMGLSPFICGYELGVLKVQFRLFLIGKNVEAERRFFNEHFFLFPKMKCVMNLSFVHPNYPKERINIEFEEMVVSSSEKTSRASVLFPIDQLVPFISADKKLQVEVDIREYLP